MSSLRITFAGLDFHGIALGWGTKYTICNIHDAVVSLPECLSPIAFLLAQWRKTFDDI